MQAAQLNLNYSAYYLVLKNYLFFNLKFEFNWASGIFSGKRTQEAG